jgi:hypothetical protein
VRVFAGTGYVSGEMRSFVVATWDQGRHRSRDLHEVRAETAENAIQRILAARGTHAVYEAWPSQEPESNLRMVFARRRK